MGELKNIYNRYVLKKYVDRHGQDNKKQALKKLVVGSIRSTLFVSVYVGTFSFNLCMLRKILGRERLTSYAVAGAMSAPTILLDKPGRILEFTIYCYSKILESIAIQFGAAGLKYTRLVDAIIMAPTYGALAHILEHYPYAASGFMKPVFRYIMGI